MNVVTLPNMISQRCEYALRALFELAARQGSIVKVSEIASAQMISPRFLENILVELKQGGFVVSTRGNNGGYMLVKDASKLTVGEIIEFIQGSTVKQVRTRTAKNGDYAFSWFWNQLADAISEVYDRITFASLLEQEAKLINVPNYII